MDFVNRLITTVSTVKSTVNQVLPGNPVTREYEAVTHVASAGPGLVWKIYAGYKKSTKQDVAVWVFEKKHLETLLPRERDRLLDSLKSGVSQLTRLRHPRMLTVEHALEESRDSLAFATEPVFASLANLLGRIDNMPSLVPPEICDLKLEPVEIQLGLLQISEGLAFLHNDAKILHRNICSESIVVNKTGDWKIAGFDFCVQNTSAPGSPASFPFVEWDPSLNASIQPSLDFMAPEFVLAGRCDGSADLFSLGMLAYALFNKGRALFDHRSNLETFRTNTKQLKTLPPKLLQNIPDEFREYVKICLNLTSELRPDATQFTKIPYFDNLGVRTIICLDSVCQLDNLQKSQFYKSLPTILQSIPKRLQQQKVMSVLVAEFTTPPMIPFVLPPLLMIADGATRNEYQSVVFPAIAPVFAVREPIQILLILLQRMDLLLSKTRPEEIAKYLLPLVYGSMEANDAKIQELCLNVIPNIIQYVDKNAMKLHLIPKLLRLATDATMLSVKVNALLCIGKLLEGLERWMVRDQILPELPKINSKEPAVLMAVLGIYRLAFSSTKLGVSKETLARNALPFLIPASVDSGLNLKQFGAFMTLIREMLDRVEADHRVKLEQLSAVQEEQRAGADFTKVMTAAAANSGTSNGLPNVFESLGFSAQNDTPSNVTSPDTMKRSTSLTLEEKQRLAKEQEQTLRFRAQGSSVLQPAAATTQNASGAMTKDLTASLFPAPPQPANPLGAVAQVRPNYSALTMGTPMGMPLTMGSTPMGMPLTMGTPMGMPALRPAGGSSAAANLDLSAFDSLAMNLKGPQQPMMRSSSAAAMSGGGVRPMMPQPLGAMQQPAPQKTNSALNDMKDLLG